MRQDLRSKLTKSELRSRRKGILCAVLAVLTGILLVIFGLELISLLNHVFTITGIILGIVGTVMICASFPIYLAVITRDEEKNDSPKS